MTVQSFYKMFMKHERLRAVLFSLFVCSILTVSIAFFALSLGKPSMGLSLAIAGGGWVVENVDANGLAKQAGIREGDKPVEVNGHPAEAFLEKYRRNGVVFGKAIKELTVVDARGKLKSATLQGGSPSLPLLIDRAARLFVSLIFWMAGFYVFFKRRGNIAALLFCLAGLSFGLTISANLAVSAAVSAAPPFEVAAALIGPWLLLHLFIVLPEERERLRSNPLVYLLYLVPAITLLLFFLVGYAEGQPVQWFRTIRLFEYGAGFLAVASVVILNYLRAASIKTRQQMKIVLIGCLSALLPFLVLYVFPQAIWRRGVIPPEFGILLIAFIPLGMGYAVLTRKLLEIDIVVRRGVVYGLITIVMAAILSVAIFLVVAFQKKLGVPEEILLALVLGAIATALFGPAKRGTEALVDRLFYKDRYDYRQIIQILSDCKVIT